MLEKGLKSASDSGSRVGITPPLVSAPLESAARDGGVTVEAAESFSQKMREISRDRNCRDRLRELFLLSS